MSRLVDGDGESVNEPPEDEKVRSLSGPASENDMTGDNGAALLDMLAEESRRERTE